MKFKSLLFILITISLTSLCAKEITPEEIFKGCAKCHGKDGKNPAFGRSEALAGQDVEELIESINFFKDSKFQGRGVTLVMSKQVKNLDDTQVENLAIYISKLGKEE